MNADGRRYLFCIVICVHPRLTAATSCLLGDLRVSVVNLLWFDDDLAGQRAGFADSAFFLEAVGFCRFGDPTKKGMMVECMAHTPAGLYEAVFLADGAPPKLGEFPVSR